MSLVSSSFQKDSSKAPIPGNTSYRELSRFLHGFNKRVLSQIGKVDTTLKPEHEPANIRRMLDIKNIQMPKTKRQQLQEQLYNHFNNFEQTNSSKKRKEIIRTQSGSLKSYDSSQLNEQHPQKGGLSKSQSVESLSIRAIRYKEVMSSIKNFKKKQKFLHGQQSILNSSDSHVANVIYMDDSKNYVYGSQTQRQQPSLPYHLAKLLPMHREYLRNKNSNEGPSTADPMIEKLQQFQNKMELIAEYRKQLHASKKARILQFQHQQLEKQIMNDSISQAQVTGHAFNEKSYDSPKHEDYNRLRQSKSNPRMKVQDLQYEQKKQTPVFLEVQCKEQKMMTGFKLRKNQSQNQLRQEKNIKHEVTQGIDIKKFLPTNSRITYSQLYFQFRKRNKSDYKGKSTLYSISKSPSDILNHAKPSNAINIPTTNLLTAEKLPSTYFHSKPSSQTMTGASSSPRAVKKESMTTQPSPEKKQSKKSSSLSNKFDYVNNFSSWFIDENAIFELQDEEDDFSSSFYRNAEKSRQSVIKKINNKSYVNKRFAEVEINAERPSTVNSNVKARMNETSNPKVNSNMDMILISRTIPLNRKTMNFTHQPFNADKLPLEKDISDTWAGNANKIQGRYNQQDHINTDLNSNESI